jgi:L-lactate dehydrogenase (cytochrome)
VSTEVELFGRRWSSPIGICPVGYGNMYWPGAEESLAAAAQAANVPFGVSTVTIKSLETLAALGARRAVVPALPPGGHAADRGLWCAAPRRSA